MVYEHSFKSSAIIERTWESEINEVYALIWGQEYACNMHLITVSMNHFFLDNYFFRIQT